MLCGLLPDWERSMMFAYAHVLPNHPSGRSRRILLTHDSDATEPVH